MRQTTAAPPLTWSQTFPGTPAQVREARQFLAALVADSPAGQNALLCLSELATNAIVHSRSGRPGGYFTVRARRHGHRLRVEVRDQGGPWTWRGSGDDHHGRGLLIVSQLASAWDRAGDPAAGWTVWFEMDCH
jgi:serine/threonine-protein kinase RsbW